MACALEKDGVFVQGFFGVNKPVIFSATKNHSQKALVYGGAAGYSYDFDYFYSLRAYARYFKVNYAQFHHTSARDSKENAKNFPKKITDTSEQFDKEKAAKIFADPNSEHFFAPFEANFINLNADFAVHLFHDHASRTTAFVGIFLGHGERFFPRTAWFDYGINLAVNQVLSGWHILEFGAQISLAFEEQKIQKDLLDRAILGKDSNRANVKFDVPFDADMRLYLSYGLLF